MIVIDISLAANFHLEGQTVEEKEDSIVVSLIVVQDEEPEGTGLICTMINNYFWGIYDKLPDKKVVLR